MDRRENVNKVHKNEERTKIKSTTDKKATNYTIKLIVINGKIRVNAIQNKVRN